MYPLLNGPCPTIFYHLPGFAVAGGVCLGVISPIPNGSQPTIFKGLGLQVLKTTTGLSARVI